MTASPRIPVSELVAWLEQEADQLEARAKLWRLIAQRIAISGVAFNPTNADDLMRHLATPKD